MDHSDDQEDFAPDDDITLQQELLLLKVMAYNNSSMAETEYERLEKEIRAKYADRMRGEDEMFLLPKHDISYLKTDQQQIIGEAAHTDRDKFSQYFRCKIYWNIALHCYQVIF
ncbi:MAG TPA: hypothetical protein VK169_14325 [Saprospiraceae bacterium]|nr:hypothetical protein [Saprospiraceae bacterium]